MRNKCYMSLVIVVATLFLLVGCESKENTVTIAYQFIPTDAYPTIEEYVASLHGEDDKEYYIIDANTYGYEMDKELHKQYLEVAKGGEQGRSLLVRAIESTLEIEVEDYFSEYTIDDECRNFTLYTEKEKYQTIKEAFENDTNDVFCFLMEGAHAIWLIEPEDRYIRTKVYDESTNELLYDSGEVTMQMVYDMLLDDGV